jgi:dynactin 1
MQFRLTEKCLKLEEEIAELKLAVDESSTLRELSEEVEEHHVEVERILRSQVLIPLLVSPFLPFLF